jgi:3-(3-hydroxy-phenyl)propionate hydroxylase
MCAGLRDAVALSWRLLGILDDTLRTDVLDSYESERIEHAKHYIQFSRDLGEIICIDDAEKAIERDARMMGDLSARNNEPITGDLVKLGAGIWCEDTATAGELSPQGMVEFDGSIDRFDQAVGQGWMILAVDTTTNGLLSSPHIDALKRLGGRLFSVGAEGRDVTTLDVSYTNWMTYADANYAIIRPDFYVAATAKTPAQLAICFDTLLERLGQSMPS